MQVYARGIVGQFAPDYLGQFNWIVQTQAKIEDLNMVEIFYRGKKIVLEKYRLYREELSVPEGQQDYNKQEALYWDLLREMGNEVGYKNLDNKTLHNRYIPNAALDDHLFSKELQAKLLEYLKSGNELQRLLIENSNNSTSISPANHS